MKQEMKLALRKDLVLTFNTFLSWAVYCLCAVKPR